MIWPPQTLVIHQVERLGKSCSLKFQSKPANKRYEDSPVDTFVEWGIHADSSWLFHFVRDIPNFFQNTPRQASIHHQTSNGSGYSEVWGGDEVSGFNFSVSTVGPTSFSLLVALGVVGTLQLDHVGSCSGEPSLYEIGPLSGLSEGAVKPVKRSEF